MEDTEARRQIGLLEAALELLAVRVAMLERNAEVGDEWE